MLSQKNHRLARWYLVSAFLFLMAAAVWVVLAPTAVPPASARAKPATASDVGVFTEYALPPNRGPWEMVWDDLRSRIWFAEGNHSSPSLDQIGSIDPGTNTLYEWGVPTAGGYVHGTSIDNSHNIWFTEVFLAKVGRLQPDSNTITEWSIDPSAEPHTIVVDDIITNSVTVWIAEREQNIISSLNPVTGEYHRHVDPLPGAWPHSTFLAPDHSIWFVETCGNRVGQLVPGAAEDTWHFWQPPTAPASCNPPNGIGPLMGYFAGSDFWYTEPYNGNIIRLRPSENSFSIWQVPGAAGGAKQVTTSMNAPDGNIFFTEMNANKLGRLEPDGPTQPTVVVVTPTVVTQAAPPMATASSASVVYTPIVTQLQPTQEVITGTRTGSIVEWDLPTPSATPEGRFVGPARSWYGGGGYWSSLVTSDQVVRFAPYTATPTMSPTPGATATPCTINFSDVSPTDYFYTPVTYLYCHGAISGYSDGTFRPYNNTTRGQLSKIVVLAKGWQLYTPPTPTFVDVPPGSAFYPYVETAYNHGIISGYSCGQGCLEFRPNNNVTRAQLTKIIVLAQNWAITPPSQPTFRDVPTTDPFYGYIETAYAHNVISGYSCGTGCLEFRPGNNATRGQISKIVYLAITQP